MRRGERVAAVVVVGALATARLLSGCAAAGGGHGGTFRLAAADGPVGSRVPHFVAEERSVDSLLDATGAKRRTDWREVWTPVCGGPPGALTVDRIRELRNNHGAEMSVAEGLAGPKVHAWRNGKGLDIVFESASSVPEEARAALRAAEEYLELRFVDPITVVVEVSFEPMEPGVLGVTCCCYTRISYDESREGLISGMDISDSIQDALPKTHGIAVRYRGDRAGTSNERRIWWTRAAFNATIGSVAGRAGAVRFNAAFDFDYDPTDGVRSNACSFQDVVVHEVGHVLGFTCAADLDDKTMDALDLFRFQRSDGTEELDYNPDSLEEFTQRPRLVSFNSPDEDHVVDLVDAEYRMSDGQPNQMSHFEDRRADQAIGLMDPELERGRTRWPEFFSESDMKLFDAIGFDR